MKEILWIPYRIYVLAFFFITLIIVFLMMLMMQIFGDELKSKLVNNICKAWAKISLRAFFIRVKISGQENIDSKSSAIFVSNHRSYIDSAILFYAIPKMFKPLGKAELGRIPIFGLIYKSVAIMVDRSSPFRRARSLKLLKRQLLRGVSVNLFPEGTFNMTDEPLIPFFNGAFKMAIETQTIIQPYIITGTQQVLHWKHAFQLYPGVIKVKYLPNISPKNFSLKDIEILKQQVFEQMQTALIAEGNW